MVKKDERVDRYIEASADFAKPILTYIRMLVHTSCPAATETMKWVFPHVMYHGILCSMASFKEHCAFTFWKGALMDDPNNVMDKARSSGMGHFGKITHVDDLPSKDVISAYIKEAMQLNKQGEKMPKSSNAANHKEIVVPGDLAKALLKNREALATFEEFSYTNKKDYIDWLEEAKTDATRKRRLVTTLEWLQEGKIRNWKYVNE